MPRIKMTVKKKCDIIKTEKKKRNISKKKEERSKEYEKNSFLFIGRQYDSR